MKRVLEDANLGIGPTTPEALIYQREWAKASAEIRAKYSLDLNGDAEIDELAKKRTKAALKEYGLEPLKKADPMAP